MEISYEAAEQSLRQMQASASKMSGWLKFMGIVMIIIGIPYAIVLIGILYIWLGVVLYQAGDAASKATPQDLALMVDKLKTYFIVLGIVMIISLIIVIIALIAIFAFGAFMGFQDFDDYALLMMM